MTKPDDLYLELIIIIDESLNKIQAGFDDYQNKCFAAKPAEFFCLELNGEAGELANIEKKKWKGEDINHGKFEDEAADVLIALMNYANARSINLSKSAIEKLARIEAKRLELLSQGKQY